MANKRAGKQSAIKRQQQSLHEVIESISGELALRPLLTRIVQHACELLDADRGTIGLVDEERGVIRTEAAYRMPPDELGAEMAPGQGLAGVVYETQQPLILNRYGNLDHALQTSLVEDAVIGLPIFWRERMVAFFGIGAAPPRSFSQEDVELLSILARHAAIAIDNANRYEAERQRTARLALIARLGQRMAARLEPEELFATTVEDLYLKLGYDHVSLFLLDAADPMSLVQRARASRWPRGEPVGYRQSIEIGILGAVARLRAPQLVNNVHQDPRYLAIPNSEGLQAEIAVPILLGDRLLGVLDVAGTGQFSQEDVTALQVVADQLAVAIDNVQMFSHTQRALTEAQLLYETSQRIGTAMDVSGVIEAYLAQVATRDRYACTIVLYEFDAAGRRVAVLIRGRWSPEEGFSLANVRLSYSRDALDPLLDAGQTVAISDVHSDVRVSPELRQIQKESGRPALALIPLIARRRRTGLVVLSYPAVHEWQENELQPYQVTAVQLAGAIDSRRQQRLLQERSRQVAVLEERQRLARELHDSVTQLIFSVTLIAQSIAPAWRRDPVEGEGRIKRLLEISQSALAEMRALLAELRPAEDQPVAAAAATPGLVRLQRDGLLVALCHYAAEIAGDSLKVDVDTAGYPAPDGASRLPMPLEETLYRIGQEALNNVVKHARARRVALNLLINEESALLTVSDDGRGFTFPEDVNGQTGRLGLQTMRERAEAAGGRLRLTSTSGAGTTVEITIPTGNSLLITDNR
jgi:signal transduction histidine kinase